MNSDFEDLLRIFSDAEVRYLIVGGYAVMLYSEPRYTKDLDIWVEPSPGNAERVFDALARFGAPLSSLTPADFALPGNFYQVGMPPVRIDIIMSIDGVEFGEAWDNRNQSPVGSQLAWFIGRQELIRNKRASGRHIDLHDAEQLEASSQNAGPGGTPPPLAE